MAVLDRTVPLFEDDEPAWVEPSPYERLPLAPFAARAKQLSLIAALSAEAGESGERGLTFHGMARLLNESGSRKWTAMSVKRTLGLSDDFDRGRPFRRQCITLANAELFVEVLGIDPVDAGL